MKPNKTCLTMGLLVVSVLCLSLMAATGQTTRPDEPASTEPVAKETTDDSPVSMRGMKVEEIIKSGGKMMYFLGGLSILTVAFVVYFVIVLRVSQVAPVPLHREVVERVRAGALDDARRACEYRSSPLASVVLAGLDYMHDMADADPALLKDVIEGEGTRQAEALQGQAQYLLDIAVIAPMMGLLGTVFGMLTAFSAVALDIAKAKPVVLAGGVSQALITTAFGLIIGIFAMVFYAIFRRQASKLVSSLESASTDVLTSMLSSRRMR